MKIWRINTYLHVIAFSLNWSSIGNEQVPFLFLLAPPRSLLSSSLGPLTFQSQALCLESQKICDLDSAGRRVVHHENILQLQVSVADILTVHLGDGVGNLPPRSSFSIKSLASSDINLIATLAKYFTYCYCLLYNKNNNIQELLKDWKFV